MGISLHCYQVSDGQLHTFQRDPAALAAWLPPFEPAGSPGVTLFNYWEDLNLILTEIAGRRGLPWSTLVEGDFRFTAVADRGAHAILSDTVRALGRRSPK